MATQKSTDYLRWNASSMKDLIVEKLNEDGVYSDQIFEGSNLSVIIDVFAYMYDVLTFYVNHSATEAIFTDAQLYENLNRIVKMLGYNPKGFITSTVLGKLGLRETYSSGSLRTIIPKYTTVTLNQNDANGNSIKYTFVEDYPFVINNSGINSNFSPTLYNGSWKLYSSTLAPQGIPFETFTLSNIDLFGEDKIFVANNMIDCYVQHEDGTIEVYQAVTNLYNSTSTDLHFEARINENKQYTLKFGDNINGKQLPPNSIIYVVYLESNGPSGQIGGNAIIPDNVLSVEIEGLSEAFIKENILSVDVNTDFITFGDPNIGYSGISETLLQYITLTNELPSTIINDLETVEEIRENAPNWFRMGSRLITHQDFQQYILSNYSNSVYDITVHNNWEYMTEFQEWLRQYDKLSIDIRNYSYYFSDSCDFNNIYLWVKSFGNSMVTQSTKTIIERDCDRLKPVTSEVVLLDPFMVAVTPYIKGDYDLTDFDNMHENKIQLIRDRNTMITVERIQQKAVDIVQTFFKTENQSLGNTINLNNLYNQLSAIDGVKLVRTKYLKSGEPESKAEYYDGLSMAIWTQHILQGLDFTKISGNFKLKSFQFPYLYNSSTFINKIEVTSDNFNISEVEY